jgi:curli biogenesis system outer membrane secretion channel CsgG
MIPSFVRLSARVAVVGSLSLAVAGFSTGCASSSESAAADTLTANVGKYDAAPKGIAKPRIGVPPFDVNAGQGFSGGSKKELNDMAADLATTLFHESDRFDVIERAQLPQLVKEQSLEGIVKPDELAKSAQVSGIDYIVLGKITNLSVKKENKSRGFGLAQVGSFLGGADVKKTDIVITSEAGVVIRLVNPTTGQTIVSKSSTFKKTDTAGAMGVDILGASAEADANIDISEDDKGKIMQLALDDAIRKSMPDIDKKLKNGELKRGGPAAAQAPIVPDAPAAPAKTAPVVAPAVEAPKSGAVAAKKFCPECGKEVPGGAKFCPVDATPIPQ